MSAGMLDIVIEKGGTFELTLDIYDEDNVVMDMSGYTPVMKIVNVAMDMSGYTPVMKIVKVATGVVINISNVSISASSILINIPTSITSIFEQENDNYTPRIIKNRGTKYAYELSIVSGEVVKKLARGNVTVVRDI